MPPEDIEIGEDDPVLLRDAVTMFFPAGGMTLSKLRKQAEIGNLAIERIGRTEFVTRRGVREMRDRCRVQNFRHDSSSEKTNGSGSSGTDSDMSAQDALRAKLSKPTKRSRDTSQRASGRTRQNVVRLPSGLERS